MISTHHCFIDIIPKSSEYLVSRRRVCTAHIIVFCPYWVCYPVTFSVICFIYSSWTCFNLFPDYIFSFLVCHFVSCGEYRSGVLVSLRNFLDSTSRPNPASSRCALKFAIVQALFHSADQGVSRSISEKVRRKHYQPATAPTAALQ